MHPLKHIFLTILLFLSLTFFVKLDISILIYSLILTILIDIIDHSFAILFFDTRLNHQIKEMIKKKRIKESMIKYYNGRSGAFEYFYLHNLPVFLIILVITVYIQSYTLFLGLIFHYICDIIECYQKGFIGFWTAGWKKMIKIE